MPEYRRFIAYFYEYIDGKKQKNAGFAKVELRNGMWRVLFRLTTDVMPDAPIQVYGFVREQGYLLGFSLGTMRTGREIAEEWAYRAEALIGHNTYRFSDLSGIWIQSGDERHFITVWDDESMNPQKFVLKLPEAEENGRGNVDGMNVLREEKTLNVQEKAEPEQRTESVVMEIEQIEVQQEDIKALEQDARVVEVNEGTLEQDVRATEQNAETVEQSIEFEEQNVEVSRIQSEEQKKDLAEGVYKKKTKPHEPELREMDCTESELQKRTSPQPLMEDILQKRKTFQPFQDDELPVCVQILPCDVVRMQQGAWQVGRSSFLQHGFYQYRHLLLGKAKDGSYILGVPGEKNPQEQYMAEMFGYDRFKCVRTCECGKKYGYWCRTLQQKAAGN